jgi:hypothetical protein
VWSGVDENKEVSKVVVMFKVFKEGSAGVPVSSVDGWRVLVVVHRISQGVGDWVKAFRDR